MCSTHIFSPLSLTHTEHSSRRWSVARWEAFFIGLLDFLVLPRKGGALRTVTGKTRGEGFLVAVLCVLVPGQRSLLAFRSAAPTEKVAQHVFEKASMLQLLALGLRLNPQQKLHLPCPALRMANSQGDRRPQSDVVAQSDQVELLCSIEVQVAARHALRELQGVDPHANQVAAMDA